MKKYFMKIKACKSLICLCFLLLISVQLSSPAFSGTGSMNNAGWYADTSVNGKYNNDGFSLKTNIYYRLRLTESPGTLWSGNGMNIGVQEFLSPAFQRLSAYLKIMPVVFFDLAVYAGHDYMFTGVTGGMKKLSSADSEYDSDTRDNIDGKPAHGFRMSVIPRVKYAYGNIAAMYYVKIEYHDYYQDGYYFDYETGLPHKCRDTGIKHDAALAYNFGSFGRAGSFSGAIMFSTYKVRGTGESNMQLCAGVQNDANWSILPENVAMTFKFAGGIHLRDRYIKHEPTFMISAGTKIKFD